MKRLLLIVLLVSAPLSGAKWLRLASPNFELYTNAGEKTGRRVLFKFEQIRQVFRDIGGQKTRSPLRVRVYLFASASEYRRYRPSKAAQSFFQGGPERDYIVMQPAGRESYRVAFHEYVHLVLNHTSARLPQWLEEGVAEFYSTIRTSGDRLVIGSPISAHLRMLARRKWLDAETLASVDDDSAIYDELKTTVLFYAQSWALVHMLNLSPDYREGMPRYAGLLAEAVPAREAFKRAFGKTLTAALADLKRYVRRGALPVVEEGWTPLDSVAIEVEPMSDAEAALARVDLQIQLGLWEASEEELRKLARNSAHTPEVETARGMVAMSRRDFEPAKAHFEKAIELGSRQATTYFEYAMLLRETGGERGRIAELLGQTVELNPNHAEAHFLLGVMASTDSRPAEVIESLRRAVSILPRQANFWHALALAYHKTGQQELARRAARRALDAALTRQEVEMAEGAIRLTEVQPWIELPERPAVNTPPGWFNKQGDSRVEGVLERIDCLGQAARLHVRSDEERVALYVANPGEVLLRNVSSVTFQFTCGEQAPRQVIVEYIAKPDPEQETAGEVTAIEFRQ